MMVFLEWISVYEIYTPIKKWEGASHKVSKNG